MDVDGRSKGGRNGPELPFCRKRVIAFNAKAMMEGESKTTLTGTVWHVYGTVLDRHRHPKGLAIARSLAQLRKHIWEASGCQRLT
jgi:hypothetical protein